MEFALTTRWNAGRHTRGETMIEEILELGFRQVELGYDLRLDLVPGVEQMVHDRAVAVTSVHNFCPVPMGAPLGHPELFTLASHDQRVREEAVRHTTETIRFAARVGASVVVTHAGNVNMKRLTPTLFDLYAQGRQYTTRYEKTRLKLQARRDRKAKKQLYYLYQGLERLLPVLEETHVRLAIENLPMWEAIPTETELERLLQSFSTPLLGYWHDMGHAQIRQNLGFINQARWLERLQPHLAGMHLHDVRPPAQDHLMPPQGDIDFARFKSFANMPLCRVIEPTPKTPKEAVIEALRYLQEVWS